MGQTVLITGASRGIGKETARLFAKNGYRVIIHYNQSEESAMTLAAELNHVTETLTVKADLSNSAQIKEMFCFINKRFGGVDVLVNNAAVSSIRMLQDISETEWDDTFDVNVKAAFLCAKEALPYMLSNKSGQIINISSIWGITGASCEVHYSASKAALIGFTKALAKELAPSNIKVNCIAPGVVDTEMNRHLTESDRTMLTDEIPLGRIATPEEIAEWVLFLAEKGGAYLTGQVISPNGGIVI